MKLYRYIIVSLLIVIISLLVYILFNNDFFDGRINVDANIRQEILSGASQSFLSDDGDSLWIYISYESTVYCITKKDDSLSVKKVNIKEIDDNN